MTSAVMLPKVLAQAAKRVAREITDIDRWRSDPVLFVETVLVDPETGRPFQLNRAQKRFLRRAFKLTKDGRLQFPEIMFCAPKKSGKTGLAAMIVIYVTLVLGGRYAEAYCIANDLEQSRGRVFRAICRIIEASPLLVADATILRDRVEFKSTRATIQAIATDYAGAAGSNPCITSVDEPWAVTSESGQRLFDEMVPPPTRKIACRLVTSYAGFEGESQLLEGLYKRGLQGEQVGADLYEQPGMLMYWTHDFTAPWQTERWREQMRASLRPNAYLRLIENRWVTSEESFVPVEWWDACVDPAYRPLVSNPRLPVWVGLDASVKRDSTAIAVCTWDTEEQKCVLVWHRIFQPSPNAPLDFEATIEKTLLDLNKRFDVRAVRFDPWQLVAVSQRLMAAGVPMREYAQSIPNLTEASQNLYELVKGRNLVAYPNDQIRLAVQRAVAIETSRGWKISKEKASHRIDIIVALGMAALGAAADGQVEDYAAPMIYIADEPLGNRYEEGLRAAGPYGLGAFGDGLRRDYDIGSMEWTNRTMRNRGDFND